MSSSRLGACPHFGPGANPKPFVTAPRACVALAAGLACATPAHANTGNFMPLLLSFFVAVPALLLVPVIWIACGKQEWKRKLPWVIAALAVAVLSFGCLFWATKTYSLLANSDWYIIYLWAVPPYVLWPIARWRLNN
jgi:hypothetical protein